MEYEKFYKKQITIIVLAVIGIALGTLGFTYAVFMQVDTNTDNQVVQSGSLIVTYNKGTTMTAQMLPMSNTNGLAQIGYSFTVQNTGTLDSEYVIKLHNNIDTGQTTTNYLAHNQLYISLDGGTPQLISSLEKENPSIVIENDIVYIMNKGLVPKSQTKNHNVKLWIKEDVDESIVGKGINLILEVEAVVSEGMPVTNMFVNASFEDIVALPWYLASFTRTNAESYFGEYSIRTTLSGDMQHINLNIEANNKYYVRFMQKVTGAVTGVSGAFGTASINLTTTTKEQWVLVSKVVTPTVSTTNGYFYLIGQPNGADPGPGFTYVDGMMAINLTATYGAGNEPTQTEMDALVDADGGFWEGTKVIE